MTEEAAAAVLEHTPFISEQDTLHDGGRVASTAIDGASWYVVYSKPHREAFTTLHLRRRGIEVFCPHLVLPAYARSPRRCVPLFPSYLFVRIDLVNRFSDVMWSPGVKRFLSANGVPSSVDDTVISFLQQNSDAEGRVMARPNLKTGQEVEIVEGPFAGLIGIIERPPDAKGRIRVLMKLLNRRSVNVQVSTRFVRSNWIA